MQLFAKFKKSLWRGFRATLNFRKFKVESDTLNENKNNKISLYQKEVWIMDQINLHR